MINGPQWVAVIQAMADAVMAQRDYLSALDATVGDGDHGVSLAKALDEAAQQVMVLSDPSPENVLQTAGLAIQNTMGGASGILFGALFMGMARESASGNVATMLAAGLSEVQKRGKAGRGDKTLVDALAPAVEAAQQGESLSRVAEAARVGAESTQNMIAKFGRAKFVGARSRGHQDAGATSIAIMFTAFSEVMKGDA